MDEGIEAARREAREAREDNGPIDNQKLLAWLGSPSRLRAVALSKDLLARGVESCYGPVDGGRRTLFYILGDAREIDAVEGLEIVFRPEPPFRSADVFDLTHGDKVAGR